MYDVVEKEIFVPVEGFFAKAVDFSERLNNYEITLKRCTKLNFR